jgi:hypothetical protein
MKYIPPLVSNEGQWGFNDVKEGNLHTHEQVIQEAKQKCGF